VLRRRLALQLLERRADLSFPKGEVAQGGEDLDSNLERPRLHAVAVFRAVGMADAQRTGFVSIDDELAAMGSPVVRSADANEVLHRVASAVGTELDVMYVEPAYVVTAWHLATMLIAQQHRAAQGGRNGLGGTPGSAHACRRLAGPGGAARVSSSLRDGRAHDYESALTSTGLKPFS